MPPSLMPRSGSSLGCLTGASASASHDFLPKLACTEAGVAIKKRHPFAQQFWTNTWHHPDALLPTTRYLPSQEAPSTAFSVLSPSPPTSSRPTKRPPPRTGAQPGDLRRGGGDPSAEPGLGVGPGRPLTGGAAGGAGASGSRQLLWSCARRAGGMGGERPGGGGWAGAGRTDPGAAGGRAGAGRGVGETGRREGWGHEWGTAGEWPGRLGGGAWRLGCER